MTCGPHNSDIVWHQNGPWINQHSAAFVDDHQISVFDNNSVAYAAKEHVFIAPTDANRVILYDFNTGKTSQPFAALLAEAKPVALWGARARAPRRWAVPRGDRRRPTFTFTRDRLLWSRLNDYDDKRIGLLMWSRYLTADEARAPLQALASRQCPAATSTVK